MSETALEWALAADSKAVARVYDEAVGRLENAAVRVEYLGAARGKGLRTTRDVAAGEALFSETPLVCMQLSENRLASVVCEHCHAYVGTLGTQLQRLALADAAVETPGLDEEDATFCETVTCVCGETYCSEACRTTAWAEQHSRLCVGTLEPDSPMVTFKNLALDANEVFLLAAKVYARVLNAYDALRETIADDAERARAAWEPFAVLQKSVWWEMPDVEAGDREAFIELAHEAVDLLAAAMPHDAVLAPMFSPDWFSHVMSMFEWNDIAIEIDSPVRDYLATMRAAGGEMYGNVRATLAPVLTEIRANLVRAAAHEHGDDEDDDDEEEEEEDDDDDDVEDEQPAGKGKEKVVESESDSDSESTSDGELSDGAFVERRVPGFFGTGLFQVVATMNHSCESVASVEYVAGGNRAVVIASEDIPAGTEVTISYIDEDGDVAERTELLSNYGFVCSCDKCNRERAEARREK